MIRQRASVFVGSSSEGLKVAKAIQILLDYSCEVTIWSQGVFGLSHGTLEALVQALDRFDFAVLVLTPDDLVVKRGEVHSAARDNVLFELGLFMGSLGRDRTFMVHERNADLQLPSDLAGVTPATFEPHSSGDLKASLGAPCSLIEEAIERLGIRTKEELKHLWRATDGVELAGAKVRQLVRLLARSRKVELDIISTQFGPMISEEHLGQMRHDLEDLEDSLGSERNIAARDVSGEPSQTLAELEIRLLEFFSNTTSPVSLRGLRDQKSLQENVAKIRYYLDSLSEKKLLEVSYSAEEHRMYRLNKAGRSFVVENGIA